MTKKREQEIRRAEALKMLRKLCPPGTTIYTVLRHVSRSGMQRRIDLYVIRKNQPVWLSGYAGVVLEMRLGKHGDGLVTDGCGMDMGFDLVHNLSYALHGYENKGPDAHKAVCLGVPFEPSRTQYRAGYSLNHEWI